MKAFPLGNSIFIRISFFFKKHTHTACKIIIKYHFSTSMTIKLKYITQYFVTLLFIKTYSQYIIPYFNASFIVISLSFLIFAPVFYKVNIMSNLLIY